MRVTTGLYKGRVLRTVDDLSVRPATDRVRQTIFNVLTHRMVMDGCTVLDMFAGSGSLGIEALSRGATHATFVESGSDAIGWLEANVDMLGCGEQTSILQMDAQQFLQQARGPFDLIFVDPPYAYAGTAGLPDEIFTRGLLAPDGYMLIEHAKDIAFTSTPLYTVGPMKPFGRTIVTFFTRSAQS
jgi:16S rRNA (guanine966-N2)-methyltransferase